MKILVAGAGIGGLTFVHALSLAFRSNNKETFTIDLIEKSPAFSSGAGIVLHPNGLKALHSIGLLEQIKPLTQVIDYMRISRDSGEVTIPLQEVWGDGLLTRTILRKDLHALLAQPWMYHTTPAIRLRMACRLEDFSFDGVKVKARLSDGSFESYDLIVAADGVHSQIRRHLFSNAGALPTNLLYFRFIAGNCIGQPENTWDTFEEENCSYGFIPVSGNRLHCFVQVSTKEYPCAPGSEEVWFKEMIATLDTRLAAAFDKRHGNLHMGFAYMVAPGNWSNGRCVLLGDAAHALSPTLSEGGSLAMEDGLVLSLALAHADSIEQGLALYAGTRQNRCMRAYRTSLAQLNALQRRPIPVASGRSMPDPSLVMAGMYRPLLEDPWPVGLESNLFTK